MKLIMPEMSGFDATKEIRAIEEQYELSSDLKHFICGLSVDMSECK